MIYKLNVTCHNTNLHQAQPLRHQQHETNANGNEWRKQHQRKLKLGKKAKKFCKH